MRRIIFILVIVLFNNEIKGQQEYPYVALQAEYGTGHIASAYNFSKNDNTLKAGTGVLNAFRSWAIFNTTVIPSNSYIEKVTLTYYVQKGSDDSGHLLEIKKLTSNPQTTDGWPLWVEIGASELYGLTENNTTTGWKGPFNITGAHTDFQTQLQNGSGWFGFAFKEYNQDDDACEIKGWEDTNYQPCIGVTFSLPAPSNVSATDNDCDKVRITWSSVNNANRYYVYRDNELLGYTTNTYYDDDNASTTSKQYKVYAGAYWEYTALTGEHSSYSGSDYGKKLDCTCNTPTGLSHSNVTSSTADINWNSVSGSDYYVFSYKKSTVSTWTDKYPTSSEYNLTGLSSNTTYEYKVRTKCDNGEFSDFTSIATFTTDVDCTTPGTPTANTPTSGSTSANFSWSVGSPTGSPTITYYWAVGTSSSVTYESGYTDRGILSGTTTSTTSLNPSTTYYFKVKAKTSCDGTYSGYSSYKQFTTDADCTTPGTPTANTPTSGSTSANFSWSAGSPTGSPTVTYYWAVGTSSTVTYESGYTDRGIVSGTTTSTNSLNPSTTYYFKVKAKTSCDGTYSGYSSYKQFITENGTSLGIPNLISPTNNSTITVPFELQWQHGENAIQSRIHIRVQGQSWEASDWLTSNSYLVDDQIEIGSYEWYIESTDGTSYTTSETWIFIVEESTSGGLDCTNAVTLTSGETYNGNTDNGNANVSNYSCNNWNEPGKEVVHKITATSDGIATIEYSENVDGYIDLFLLGSCDTLDCIAAWDGAPSVTATFDVLGGNTYYLVTDVYQGDLGGDYSLKVTLPEVSNSIVWSDGFETYSLGTFPGNWVADGNATNTSTNFVNNEFSNQGAQSLKLYGTVGGCWGALTYRSINEEQPFEVQVAVRNGNETLSGCHPDRAGIGLRQGTSWSNPSRTFIRFLGDGTIISGGNTVSLGSYNTLDWYIIKVRYEKPSSTNIKLSYWINNIYKGSETLTAISSEDLLTNLELHVQEGTAWFDDIVISTFNDGFVPIANFSATPTSGTKPLTVQFTDQSTDATSWSWNFGDDNTSLEQNPSHTYNDPGDYTVTLTATNEYGNDIETKTNYISVDGNSPIADFSADNTSVAVNESINFTDQSTDATSWSWDFGDGNTSTEQNPSHAYTSVDIYTVSLTVYNTYGSDTETKTDFISIITGIEDINTNNQIIIYPNPTNGTLIFKSSVELDYIEIYDIIGSLIYKIKFEVEIDISNFNEGIYLLKLYSKEEILKTEKIILND